MLYACVQRFDVMGTVEILLKTKQAIKPILLPKFSNLSAAAHRLFFLKRTGEALLEKKAQNAIFHINYLEQPNRFHESQKTIPGSHM